MNHDALWHIAGWTMIHYLWVGTFLAAAALVCRVLLRHSTPNLRYATSLVSLTVLAATPLVICAWLFAHSSAPVLPSNLAEALPRFPAAHTPIIELSGGAIEPTAIPVPEVVPGQPIPTRAQSPLGTHPLAVFAIQTIVPHLPWLWLLGTPITFMLLAAGIVGTKRLRRASRPLDEGPITQILARLTTALRVGQRVSIAVCDRIAAPVLIGIVRPMILLPPAALTGWSPDEIEMVLLHELAHVRRWDNLVNLLQRLIESLLFFHPAVWLISNWVRREREACCDAVVVARTHQPHAYAELLVALAAQMPRSVLFHPAASSAMAAGPLRGRIRRILQLENDPMLISGKSFILMLATIAVAATMSVLYLPAFGRAEESKTEAAETAQNDNDEVDAEDLTRKNLKQLILALHNNHGNRGSLPANAIYDDNGKPLLSWRVHVLPFLGEERLYQQIRLDEPWDSEHNRKFIPRMPDVFKNPKISAPGKTNYLAVIGEECAFTGVTTHLKFSDITDGTSKTVAIVEANPEHAVEWTKPQDWEFDRRHPTRGLGSLWGDYWFGAWLDGSVRRVGNSEPSDAVGIYFTRAGREIESLKESEDEPSGGAEEPTSAEISHIVRFEQGGSQFAPGDNISVLEVRGTAKTFKPGNKYWIRGTYTLASRDQAQLSAFTTAADAAEGTSAISAVQTTNIDRGTGNFTLILPMTVRGWPHVSFYPAGGGEGFGGIYFGTGDSVLKNVPWFDEQDKSASKFPSLEDQKLADLAYRRLNLELEPIGEQELTRVRELGYDGGVKVAQVFGEAEGRFLPHDILVGLHVWPTTSMTAVAEVLNRDDLSELNPLKYYVVRSVPDEDPLLFGDKDAVVTGRISVNVEPQHEPAASDPLTPVQSNPSHSGIAGPSLQLAAQEARNEQLGRIGLGNGGQLVIKGNGLVFFFDRDNSQSRRLRKSVSDLRKQFADDLTVFIVDTNWNPEAAEAFEVDVFPALVLFKDGKTVWQTTGEFTVDDILAAFKKTFGKLPAPSHDALAANGASLHYDGKSFDDWREAMRTELSTEKRHEAVKALAAFGRAGIGAQAAEAILDVAGQYDFYMIDTGSEGKLKDTVLSELAPHHQRQLLTPYWLPSLASRLQSEPKRWTWLAYHLLVRIQADDEQAIATLRSLAKSGPNEVRAAALGALIRASQAERGKPQLDSDTRDLLTTALKSDNRFLVRSALTALVYDFGTGPGESLARLLFQPELLPLLFHRDESIQQEARRVLKYVSSDDAPTIVESLVAILKDDSRQADHVSAIRALSAMGRHAEPATLKLEKLLKESPGDDNLLLRVAAGFALDRIEGGQRGGNNLLESLNHTPHDQVKTRFNRMINEEGQIQQQ